MQEESADAQKQPASVKRFFIRMARPLLQIISRRLHVVDQGSDLVISTSTLDTQGDAMEVAQLHSFVASARSLHARMKDGPADVAFQGRAFRGGGLCLNVLLPWPLMRNS